MCFLGPPFVGGSLVEAGALDALRSSLLKLCQGPSGFRGLNPKTRSHSGSLTVPTGLF